MESSLEYPSIADFFDIFYMGEGETQYMRLMDVYEECRIKGVSREDFLYEASKIPGLYVPSLYKHKILFIVFSVFEIICKDTNILSHTNN